MKELKVLVTGCGGDIGQSIGKILLECKWVSDLRGVDISGKNAAKFIFPSFQIAPRVSDDRYLSFLLDYVHSNKIDLVIPVAEPELRQFALMGWSSQTIGTNVVMANSLALNVGFDKLATIDFLANNGFAFPQTQPITTLLNFPGFPVIFKSRTGSGSKSIVIVRDAKSFDFYLELFRFQDFIIQEYISEEEGEYTCGVFRSGEGEIRSIVFRRELMGGFSGYGEIVESELINEILRKLAKALNLRGSINVQLRLHNGIPYIFEINPRFSSTVYFRYLFGFEDVLWSMSDLMGEPLPNFKLKTKIKRFYKGFSEFVD